MHYEEQIQHISVQIKYNCSSQFIYVFKVFESEHSAAPCPVLLTTEVHPSGSSAPCPVLPTTEAHPSGLTDREDARREDSCKWTTVVRSGVKRRAMAATSPTPSKATAHSKGLVIGSASVKGMTAAVNRKRRANIFATRFSPDQCPDELKSYLDKTLNVSVTCTQLGSKYPESYTSFYISAEVDNPNIFMNEQIWPEGIFVRWYRPTENTRQRASPVITAAASCVATTDIRAVNHDTVDSY